MEKKTAVILFNLGGPDRPESVRPFLKNFFSDKNIITLPALLRLPLAAVLAARRAKGAAREAYGALGGKSPLLENTKAQANALQAALGKDFRVFVSMRYWHPRAAEIVRAVKKYAPDEIVLLPLYPQFSTTTSRSSFQEWESEAQKAGLRAQQNFVCCYPMDDGFVKASARRIQETIKTAQRENEKPRVLFSAHGLPEKIILSGDPYQWQCEQSAAAIAAAAGLAQEDWRLCYQSRVGRLKWIGPSVEEELASAAADNVPVVIYPHAFVSEHVETLVEIEIDFRALAENLGVPGFYRVETVGADAGFIEGLAQIVRTSKNRGAVSSASGARLCPGTCTQCAMRENTAALAAAA